MDAVIARIAGELPCISRAPAPYRAATVRERSIIKENEWTAS